MNMTILIIVMLVVTLIMGFITFAVILANNMTFDDVVDAAANETKIIANRSARVVTRIIEGG